MKSKFIDKLFCKLNDVSKFYVLLNNSLVDQSRIQYIYNGLLLYRQQEAATMISRDTPNNTWFLADR